MSADGKMIGRVTKVDNDVAHVKPENQLDQSIRQKLGWTSEGEEVYELPNTSVESVDDSGVHLKESF